MTDAPQTNRGWLRNGGRPGDLRNAKRCGAKTRKGAPCQSPATANGRCRMHGGPSTGAKTPEGKARCRMSNYKHGHYAYEAIKARRLARLLRDLFRP